MMFKFRTMTVNADQAAHQNHFKQYIGVNIPMVKLDAVRDARLIPGGWLLRATGLDELPQIINVIRGDMSLVGPRPCLPSEFADYMPAQRERVNAVPGLTGLWQVSGKNRTTFAEMIRLDIHYARHTSLLLNLRIIALTPLALGSQVIRGPVGNRISVAALREVEISSRSGMRSPRCFLGAPQRRRANDWRWWVRPLCLWVRPRNPAVALNNLILKYLRR
jgi:hypothetical protein